MSGFEENPVDGGMLTPDDVRRVQDDTAKAFQDSAKKFDAQPPSPPPPDAPGAPPGAQPSQAELMEELEELPEWTPQDVIDLLTYTDVELGFFPEDSAMWHAPNEREKRQLSKPAARVLSKWMPFVISKYRDEVGLAVAILMIGVARRRNAKKFLEARAAEKKAAEEKAA